MSRRTLLLSVKPDHAEGIFDGSKTVELRRLRPGVNRGDRVLVYVTSPVRAVVGSFVVESVVVKSPPALWSVVHGRCGLSLREYQAYFTGASRGVGIFLTGPTKRATPLPLDHIRASCPGFRPPQGYRYLRASRVRERDLCELLAQ